MSAAVEHLGRYELLLALAKGGMAELYLARLHGAGGFEKIVAIKRILPHLAEDKLFVEMFLNEGRIASRLHHGNVCQVFELGEAEGELFLVMEYLEGVSWEALIREMPRTPETLRLAAGVIAQACDGLHYAHELKDVDGTPTPVIHRDVSPQNLFVTADGTCKVLDFGVSKMTKDGPRTRTGVLKGKLPYMSPEQIQGEPLDARSDVFALGVCVWEALTGASLFDRDTDFLIWKAITEAPIPKLSPHGFPAQVDALLASALERDKERRFRSAKALGEALRRAADAVGGALSREQIAAVVKQRCGAALAERAQEVRGVVTGRRSKPVVAEPTAADTIEEAPGSTVNLRPASVKIQRAEAAPPPGPRWPWLVGAGVLAGAAVLAWLAMREAGDATPPAKAAPSPAAHDDRLSFEGSGLCPRGKTCDLSCTTGGCNFVCEGTCTTTCAGGHCDQRCLAGATCTFGCSGGSCAHDCTQGTCSATCAGGGCTTATTPPIAKPALPAPTPSVVKPTTPKPPKPSAPKPAETRAPVNEEPGTFTIDSMPYATIYIDGTKLGDTPLQAVKVDPGKHVVRAVRAEGLEKIFTVEIKPGQDTNTGRLSW